MGKVCNSCGVYKAMEDFPTDNRLACGRAGRCRACCNENRKGKFVSTASKREKNKQAVAKYQGSYRGQVVLSMYAQTPKYKRMHARNRHKRHALEGKYKDEAREKVRQALRNGTLAKKACEVCGAMKVHAHHDSYLRPLDVRWLCPQHHGQEHAKENSNA